MDHANSCFLKIQLTCAILAYVANALSNEITFAIDEELPIGSFVGNIFTSPMFLNDIPIQEIGYIKIEFLQQNSIQTLLSFHESSGNVTTAVIIDRESKNVCLSLLTCSFTFDIAIRSSRPQSFYFHIISVTVAIRDINDNAPQFPKDVISLEISESIITGTSFVIDSAVDLDVGINSVQGYEIRQQDGNFSLDVVRKLDGDFTVKLILNSLLDREIKDKYGIDIIAMDDGNPKMFGAVFVNIAVTDVNDNAPVFLEPSYNISIQENITVGGIILAVSATDKDIGINGEVSYKFSQNQLDARVYDLFAISAYNGELILKNKLVYSSSRLYKIIVEATDGGTQAHVTQVIVTINVIDVGNNPPILQINLLSQTNSQIVNISEAANYGMFVAHVNVIDKDTGVNGDIECNISDKKFALISMGGKGFKVTVDDTLDRETQSLHQILISCHDLGSPSLSASASFLVSLDDVNDCAPMFTQPVFNGSIPENYKEFKTFTQITAYDEDLGVNAEIRYYIDEASTSYKFWIDPVTGKLRADQIFDRETTSEIVFKVIASDLGNPPMSSKATVKLIILDQNDNAPTITDVRRFSIEENKNSDSFVGQLNATDLDVEENARVKFVIVPEFEFSVPFVVFPDGTIKTNIELDREVERQYNITVVAFDQGSPRLLSSANITVDVTDANDNSPIFQFPNGKNNIVTVSSNYKLRQEVTKIEAFDLDEGNNSIISYDITDGNDDDLFVIDNKMGTIYITKEIKVNQNRTFRLRIAVRDGGHPPRTTESVLNIVFIQTMNFTGLPRNAGTINNAIIVIVIVILTVILSVIMIIAICFIRLLDHRGKVRKDLDVIAPDEKYPKCYLENGSLYLGTSKSSYDMQVFSYGQMSSDLCTKKKEVSFDVDERLEHNDIQDRHNTTMSTFIAHDQEKVPRLPNLAESEEISNQVDQINTLQLLQFHQAILESQTRAWLQEHETQVEESSFEVTLPEDKGSYTSEEITASDSGKGGSDDDTPSNHSRDPKPRVNGAQASSFQTRHYVAPELRRQDSLQRKACNITYDLSISSSPVLGEDGVWDRTGSCSSIFHSTPRQTSCDSHYPHINGQTLVKSTEYYPTKDDSASYV